MKVLIQRVNHANVRVGEEVVGEIGPGLLLLVGFSKDDSEQKLQSMAEKIVHLRIFKEGEKHFHRSLLEVQGELLVVSQFTLCADTKKGRRPDFADALDPALAAPLFKQFVALFSPLGVAKVGQGMFGEDMQISLENDGPVTILLEN